MKKSARKPALTIYVTDREKSRLLRLADRSGFKRQEYLLASLIVGAVLIESLDKGEIREVGLGKTMVQHGRRIAAALMASGVSSVLNEFVSQIGPEVDLQINAGQKEWESI